MMTAAGPLGAIASAALVVLWIGYAEGVYRNPPARALVVLVPLLLTGVAGLYVQFIAWRAALRTPIGPGCCQKCGYDLKELARCPECGTVRPGTLHTGTIVEKPAHAGAAGGSSGGNTEPGDTGSR